MLDLKSLVKSITFDHLRKWRQALEFNLGEGIRQIVIDVMMKVTFGDVAKGRKVMIKNQGRY
jgi:hypothetical protein